MNIIWCLLCLAWKGSFSYVLDKSYKACPNHTRLAQIMHALDKLYTPYGDPGTFSTGLWQIMQALDKSHKPWTNHASVFFWFLTKIILWLKHSIILQYSQKFKSVCSKAKLIILHIYLLVRWNSIQIYPDGRNLLAIEFLVKRILSQLIFRLFSVLSAWTQAVRASYVQRRILNFPPLEPSINMIKHVSILKLNFWSIYVIESSVSYA